MPLAVRFPRGVVYERVALPMIDPASATQITWHFKFDAARHEYLQSHELIFACKVREL